MNTKIFSQRFNRELTILEIPEEINERIKAVVKVFNVTRHLAHAMISGNLTPSSEQLNNIAEILEVCPKWLSGSTDRKKPYDTKAC